MELGIFAWEGQFLFCRLYLKKMFNSYKYHKGFKKNIGGPWLPHPLVVVLPLIWRLRNQVIFPITSWITRKMLNAWKSLSSDPKFTRSSPQSGWIMINFDVTIRPHANFTTSMGRNELGISFLLIQVYFLH